MGSIRKLLTNHSIKASAPCRIDSGGTWDIKTLALPFEQIQPITLNFALDIRTTVSLLPFEDNQINILSHGFTQKEGFHKDQASFKSPFGLFSAAIMFFDFHGLEIRIQSKAPVKASLGGSSTALVALIKALAIASELQGGKKLSKKEILHISYYLEDAISGGNCGLQDAAAAVYGGCHKWIWRYSQQNSLFKRTSILDKTGEMNLSRHLLVAYSGKSHVSADVNKKWLNDFLSNKTRSGWIKVNQIVHKLAQSIENQDWQETVKFLKEEMAIRREITPEALIPITHKLICQAETLGCGARFAGAGAGGSLWAIGELDKISVLKKIWGTSLKPIPDAQILKCNIDHIGAK